MEAILEEIERALEARLYYLAVVMSLTLPDICAALESEDGRTSRSRYTDWYDAHLAAEFPAMSAVDCYSLRCGVVHQGRLGVAGNQQFGRVIFTLPEPHGIVIEGGIINDALQLDAVLFCKRVISVVRVWFANVGGDPRVRSNLPNLVQFREHGIAPYIVGMPVIA